MMGLLAGTGLVRVGPWASPVLSIVSGRRGTAVVWSAHSATTTRPVFSSQQA